MMLFLQQVYTDVITTEIQKLDYHAVATFVKWANLFLTRSCVVANAVRARRVSLSAVDQTHARWTQWLAGWQR
jgi:hypothetical protein